MSCAEGGKGEQEEVMSFHTMTDEEREEDESEERDEEEEEDSEDLSKIAEEAKQIRVNSKQCTGLSFGTTLNIYGGTVHLAIPHGDARNLSVLPGGTPNQVTISLPSNPLASQPALCYGEKDPSQCNHPLPPALRNNTQCYSLETAEPPKDTPNPKTSGNWFPHRSTAMGTLLAESPNGICYNNSDSSRCTGNEISGINGLKLKSDNSRQNAHENRTHSSLSPTRSPLQDGLLNKLKKLDDNFVAFDGYAVGIEPGQFYEFCFEEGWHIVEMTNGSEYCIKLTNSTDLRCNVNVHVDGQFVAALQMDPQSEQILEGPLTTIEEYKKFMFLRASDAPEEAEINSRSEENGIVMVEFIPELISPPVDTTDEENEQPSTISPFFRFCLKALGVMAVAGTVLTAIGAVPTSDVNFPETSIVPATNANSIMRFTPVANENYITDFTPVANDITGHIVPATERISSMGPIDEEISDIDLAATKDNTTTADVISTAGVFCAGATALIGRQQRREYDVAETMPEDKDKTVIIILRLVARRTDELFVPPRNDPIKPLRRRPIRCPPAFNP